VLNGHSIGGSIALLILFEMTLERGTDYVRGKVKKVYTFGSPPIAVALKEPKRGISGPCTVLNSFGLPSTMVISYIQPWDPIVRLFTTIDALYPLAGDIGEDGVTPLASGPPRTLRPIVKSIVEAWAGWPGFRDNVRANTSQNYTNVGIPHLLLPDPTRYLADRFFAVSIPVPAVETILRVSPQDLQSILETIFLLDVFELSLLPQAIRGFVHHFYPAYDNTMLDYVKRLEQRYNGQVVGSVADFLLESEDLDTVNNKIEPRGQENAGKETNIGWRVATQWFQG